MGHTLSLADSKIQAVIYEVAVDVECSGQDAKKRWQFNHRFNTLSLSFRWQDAPVTKSLFGGRMPPLRNRWQDAPVTELVA